MLTLDERLQKYNDGLNELAALYGLRPVAQMTSVPVTRGETQSIEVMATVILVPVEGWVEPKT
jgi:hypothetical protein